MNFQEFLTTHKCSPSAISWVGDKTAEQAWNQCPRVDWLLWMAGRVIHDGMRQPLVGAAADIARTALSKTQDQRVHDCMAAVDRWLAGEQVTIQAVGSGVGAWKSVEQSVSAAAMHVVSAVAADSIAQTFHGAWCAMNWTLWAISGDDGVEAKHADIVRKHLPWTTIAPLLERAMQGTP